MFERNMKIGIWNLRKTSLLVEPTSLARRRRSEPGWQFKRGCKTLMQTSKQSNLNLANPQVRLNLAVVESTSFNRSTSRFGHHPVDIRNIYMPHAFLKKAFMVEAESVQLRHDY